MEGPNSVFHSSALFRCFSNIAEFRPYSVRIWVSHWSSGRSGEHFAVVAVTGSGDQQQKPWDLSGLTASTILCSGAGATGVGATGGTLLPHAAIMVIATRRYFHITVVLGGPTYAAT